MELLRLVLLLCLAGQALGKPVPEPDDLPHDTKESDPTVFEVIEEANRDSPVLLKEGDIVIATSRNALACDVCKWNMNENGTVPVPYVIDPHYSASQTSLIIEALREFEVMTCVRFVNRSSEDDYLYIEPKSGCFSSIGKTMGRQSVSISTSDCMRYGVIQHEAMHNLGFYHEHTRDDRDKYIDIKYENLRKGDVKQNFEIAEGNHLNLPYDYASVLHYGMYAYSKNPSLPTIVPKPDPNVPIGQRLGMTNMDVKKVNTFYNCSLCREKLLTASGTFYGNSSAIQNGGNCLWLIQVPINKVSLYFEHLNISSLDYIKVYDGLTKSSPVLLEETDRHEPIPPLVSSGKNMLIELVSSNHSKFSTFHASYGTVSNQPKQ